MVDRPSYTLTLWTNDPTRAAWADQSGVDRIGVDLETIGKEDRQRGLPTWISPHKVDDLRNIRPSIKSAAVFVRSNPLHDSSRAEVEQLISAGAQVLMLPNFTTAQQVERFLSLVDGRARIVPLVERQAALEGIRDLASLGLGEVHIGLNDLSIELGEPNRLVVMAMTVMDQFAEAAHAAGIRFGLGGLGRAGDEDLPVPSDLVYAQHARLGASGALLARSFFRAGMDGAQFGREIARLRVALNDWTLRSPADLEQSRLALLRYREQRT